MAQFSFPLTIGSRGMNLLMPATVMLTPSFYSPILKRLFLHEFKPIPLLVCLFFPTFICHIGMYQQIPQSKKCIQI